MREREKGEVYIRVDVRVVYLMKILSNEKSVCCEKQRKAEPIESEAAAADK